MITTTYILTFFVLCAGSVGLGNLYLYLITPGQLLSFVQPLLVSLSKVSSHHKGIEFLYKSIGGCAVCTRQRFTDLSFIFLCFALPFNWWYVFPLYAIYGGLAFYFDALNTNRQTNITPPKIKQQTIEL